MARSLSSIISQIERLQKEAAAIQSEVVDRIRKDITKFGLTAEQLFGTATVAKPARKKAPAKATKVAKAPKYADQAGNTWGGMGKRPDWLRQALASGKALEDFLIAPMEVAVTGKTRAKSTKVPVKAKTAPLPKPAAKKRTVARGAPARKKVVESPTAS